MKQIFGEYLPSVSGKTMTQFVNLFDEYRGEHMRHLKKLYTSGDINHSSYSSVFYEKARSDYIQHLKMKQLRN